MNNEFVCTEKNFEIIVGNFENEIKFNTSNNTITWGNKRVTITEQSIEILLRNKIINEVRREGANRYFVNNFNTKLVKSIASGTIFLGITDELAAEKLESIGWTVSGDKWVYTKSFLHRPHKWITTIGETIKELDRTSPRAVLVELCLSSPYKVRNTMWSHFEFSERNIDFYHTLVACMKTPEPTIEHAQKALFKNTNFRLNWLALAGYYPLVENEFDKDSYTIWADSAGTHTFEVNVKKVFTSFADPETQTYTTFQNSLNSNSSKSAVVAVIDRLCMSGETRRIHNAFESASKIKPDTFGI